MTKKPNEIHPETLTDGELAVLRKWIADGATSEVHRIWYAWKGAADRDDRNEIAALVDQEAARRSGE